MLVKKVRCLGLLVLVVALATFLTGCRYPGIEEEYLNGGGGDGIGREVRNMPGFPGGAGGGSGGGSGLPTIDYQINFLRNNYNNDDNPNYDVFNVRANFQNEILPRQQDLNFSRNITVRIKPPIGYTDTRTIIGNNDPATGGLSLFAVRNNTTLILHDIIVKESNSPIRTESLVTVGGRGVTDANMEMTGRSEITRGRRRAVVVAGGSSLIMRDRARIHANSHIGAGGGVEVSGSGATLRMYDFAKIYRNNTTGRGGGVNLHNGSIIMKNNASISRNKADSFGGGVHIANNNVKLSMHNDATIQYNTAQDGGGAAIMLGGSQPTGFLLMHDNSLIRRNTAFGRGGGVFLGYDATGTLRIYNGTVYGSDCDVNYNSAGINAAIFRMSGNHRVQWGVNYPFNVIPWLGTNGTDNTIKVKGGVLQ